jgi:hypothetical protein
LLVGFVGQEKRFWEGKVHFVCEIVLYLLLHSILNLVLC